MLDYRSPKTAPTDQLLAHFQVAFERSDTLRKWFGAGYGNMTVGKCQDLLLRRIRKQPEEFGSWAITLAETLLNLRRSSPERVGTSLVLLMLVCSYWSDAKNGLEQSQLHRQGGRTRLSLEILAADVEQMRSETLGSYLQWAVENYVFKQATKVALGKLPDYRYFIVRDDNGYRLVKPDQRPSSYLSYDPSRIESAFALMSELNLIDPTKGYRLTRTGRNVLQALRAHHQM
jgi:hypothetical protein